LWQKQTAKAKTDSAQTARARRSTGIILQAIRQYAQISSLHSHPFVILWPDNPDYTARDVMAARVMSPFGALKDKCIQTH
jgi:hypothetical protein